MNTPRDQSPQRDPPPCHLWVLKGAGHENPNPPSLACLTPPPPAVTALQALLWGKCPCTSPCPWPRGFWMGPSEPLSAPRCRCESVKSSSGTPGSSPVPLPPSPWTPLPGRSGQSVGSAGGCRGPVMCTNARRWLGVGFCTGLVLLCFGLWEETVTRQVGDKGHGDALDFAVSTLMGLRTGTPRL